MIFGECPYPDCGKPYNWSMREGKVQKFTCEGCGRRVWLIHSKWQPEGITESEFHKRYELNETEHSVTRKFIDAQKGE